MPLNGSDLRGRLFGLAGGGGGTRSIVIGLDLLDLLDEVGLPLGLRVDKAHELVLEAQFHHNVHAIVCRDHQGIP